MSVSPKLAITDRQQVSRNSLDPIKAGLSFFQAPPLQRKRPFFPPLVLPAPAAVLEPPLIFMALLTLFSGFTSSPLRPSASCALLFLATFLSRALLASRRLRPFARLVPHRARRPVIHPALPIRPLPRPLPDFLLPMGARQRVGTCRCLLLPCRLGEESPPLLLLFVGRCFGASSSSSGSGAGSSKSLASVGGVCDGFFVPRCRFAVRARAPKPPGRTIREIGGNRNYCAVYLVPTWLLSADRLRGTGSRLGHRWGYGALPLISEAQSGETRCGATLEATRASRRFPVAALRWGAQFLVLGRDGVFVRLAHDRATGPQEIRKRLERPSSQVLGLFSDERRDPQGAVRRWRQDLGSADARKK